MVWLWWSPNLYVFPLFFVLVCPLIGGCIQLFVELSRDLDEAKIVSPRSLVRWAVAALVPLLLLSLPIWLATPSQLSGAVDPSELDASLEQEVQDCHERLSRLYEREDASALISDESPLELEGLDSRTAVRRLLRPWG